MSPRLTSNELIARARLHLADAWLVFREAKRLGRSAGRTTRQRGATGRAARELHRAVFRGLGNEQARIIYEGAPPDPEYGAVEWGK